jgi:HEAT repeat protein
MLRLSACAMFVAMVCLMGGRASGHGGSYPSAEGAGSGESNGATGGATPGSGGGPDGGGSGATGGSTPSGSGTTGGTGGGGGPPVRPGSAGTPGAAPGTGGATGGSRKKSSGDGQGMGWDSWWFYNDDKYLQLKLRVRQANEETEAGCYYTSEVRESGAIERAPLARIQQRVIPALKSALADKYFDARAAASIALGKAGALDPAALAIELKKHLTDEQQQVRESACLALGLLGAKEAIDDLVGMMQNSPAARKAYAKDGKDIQSRTRAFAALGLGLIGARADIGDTHAITALLAQVRSDSTTPDDVVCPIVALGVMRCQEAVPTLCAFLDDDANPELARSYAATSLGKIGNRGALAFLMRALEDKHGGVRQSAAIALGVLADTGEAAISSALQRLVRGTPDPMSRNFAMIALGEIGGVDNRNFLSKMLDDGNRFLKTYGAIALGVYATKNGGDAQIERLGERILAAFNSERNYEERGAYAIALGLMRYEKAGPALVQALDDGGQAAYRGHLCTALGLLSHRPAIKAIEDVVKEKGDVVLRRSASIALGLLGDKDAIKVLEAEMAESSNSQAVHGAVTQGLGFIGDSTAVPRLVQMVQETEKYQDATRAFAAVALGLLADKDELPFLSLIAQDNNYRSQTAALAEVLTIL